jgi:hypothetical protein
MPDAAAYDIPVRQGNTLQRTFAFQDEDGDAIDLTGSVVAFRAETGEGATFITKTTPSSGLSMATPTNGQVTLILTPAETAQFATGRVNRYEIERRVSGNESTLVAGFIDTTEGVNDNV